MPYHNLILKSLKRHGISLMEVIVTIFIIMILVQGVYSLIILSLRINSDNKSYVEAIEIANQKMEEIRNLPYDDVGTLTGSPAGIIPEYETINRNDEFTVHNTIIFFDDPYDGLFASGTDSIFVDYKIATIEVSWVGRFENKNVTVFSKIIPNTEETLSGYGLLKLSIVDSNGDPVPSANIHIENTSPLLNADYSSDSNGELSLPLLPDFEGYEVTVTKAGFSTAKTYARDLSNANPTKPNISIFDGVKTEDSLAIDTLGVFNIKTVSNSLPDNWQVNKQATSSDEINPSLGVDNADNIYFCWQSNSATSSLIKIQKYNSPAFNSQWTNDIGIATSSFQKNPDIAVANNGNSFVVWQDNSTILKLISKHNTNKHFATLPKTKLALVPDFNKIISYPRLTDNFSFQNNKTFFEKNSLSGFIKNYFSVKKAIAAPGDVTLVGVGPGTTTGNSTTISLTVPAGVQEHDLLLAFIHHDDHSDGPMIPPAGEGWIILDNDLDPSGSYSNSRGNLFYKFAGSSEPSSYTFTLNSHSEQKAGHIRAYRNVDQSNPFDGTLVMTTTPRHNYNHSAPSRNINNDGSMLVCGWGADTETLGYNGPTFPAGMSNTINNNASNITAASADLAVDIADSPTGLKIFDANYNVTRASADWSLVIKPAPDQNFITVSSLATQTAFMLIPSNNQFVGGSFALIENINSRNVTNITITENGTVDALQDINNVKLFYDEDVISPYDCADENYNPGTDAQFGTTTTFNAPNGTANFSEIGGITVNTAKTLCLYTVLDVNSSAFKDDSLEIEISNPQTDITVDSGSVTPATPITLANTTYLLKPANTDQIHYRWRNDDNSEESASWKETEDSPTTITKNTNLRLRFELTNTGSFDTASMQFVLEYAEKNTTCAAINTWTTVPTDNSKHWQITNSTYLTNNATTTNVFGGLNDENTSFKPGIVQDTSNISGPMDLTKSEFSEFEYNLIATNNALDSSYCFRLSDNGATTSMSFSEYAEAAIVGDDNIYIYSLDSNGNKRWGIKKVNSDLGDQSQSYPKIAIDEKNGAPTTTVVWVDNRNGNSDIYAQSYDDAGNKLWPGDIQLSSSSTDEHSPSIAFDNHENIFVAWVNNESRQKIYLDKIDLNGNSLWGTPKSLFSSSSDEYSPQLALDANDNIFITWTDNDGSTENSYVAKFSSTTNLLWLRRSNTEYNTEDQYDSSLTLNGSDLYVSWTDFRYNNQDIFAQKYDLNGIPQWTNDSQININLAHTSQLNSSLITNSLGKAVAVWQDNRNSDYDIFASELADPSTLTPVANVPLVITGTKRIGENPVIIKYTSEFTTDANGELAIPIEWDNPGYSVELKSASTSLNIIFRDPIQPLKFLAGESQTMIIYVE